MEVPPTYHHTAVHFGKSLYVFGGINKSDILYKINLARSKLEKFKVATTRHSHSAVIYNDSLFVFGGSKPFGFFTLSDKIHFEPFETTTISPPFTLEGSSAVVYNDEIYLFGGMVDKKSTNTLYVFKNNSWTILEYEGSPSPRQYHSACAVGHSMYVYGGESSEGILNDLWQFDLSKKSWERLGECEPRSGHCMVAFENKLIIHGGRGIYSYPFLIYNIVSKSWVEGNVQGKCSRYFHTMNLYKDKLYIFGGLDKDGKIMGDMDSIKIKSIKMNKCRSKTVPNDVLSQMANGPFFVLLSWLDIKSLLSLSCVNHLLYQKTCKSIVWKEKCAKLAGDLSCLDHDSQDSGHYWKSKYIEIRKTMTSNHWFPRNARLGKFPKTCEIRILGLSCVGKSAIVVQYVQHVFIERYLQTTEEDRYRKLELVDQEQVLFDIIDITDVDWTILRDDCLRSASGFVIVYSIADRKSFQEVETFYDQIIRVKDELSFPVVLVGNKIDLKEERQVSTLEGLTLAQKLNVPFFEASAKMFTNVNEPWSKLVHEIAAFRSRHNEEMDAKEAKQKKCNVM